MRRVENLLIPTPRGRFPSLTAFVEVSISNHSHIARQMSLFNDCGSINSSSVGERTHAVLITQSRGVDVPLLTTRGSIPSITLFSP